jgi:hypothetical protein
MRLASGRFARPIRRRPADVLKDQEKTANGALIRCNVWLRNAAREKVIVGTASGICPIESK